MIRWPDRWLFVLEVRRLSLVAKPEYVLSKFVNSWVTGVRRTGVPILHFHTKNEGKRDAPQTWVEKALGVMQIEWPDITLLISVPGLPQIIVMVEIKVSKPGTAANKLSDNQKLFRNAPYKPYGYSALRYISPNSCRLSSPTDPALASLYETCR